MESRQIARKALDLLKPYLHAFAAQRLEHVYGEEYNVREPRIAQDPPDIHGLFGVYLEHWQPVFSAVLDPGDRSLIFELKEIRNKWAHERPISLDEAYRALDSVERLLKGLGAVAMESKKIQALKHEIRVKQVDAGMLRAGGHGSRERTIVTFSNHSPHLGKKGAELRGKILKIAPRILKDGNPRRPHTHGWLAFEILRRAEDGTLSFEEYARRLFEPDPDIRELAKAIPGVPNAYQDLKHIRHDIRHGRIYVQ